MVCKLKCESHKQSASVCASTSLFDNLCFNLPENNPLQLEDLSSPIIILFLEFFDSAFEPLHRIKGLRTVFDRVNQQWQCIFPRPTGADMPGCSVRLRSRAQTFKRELCESAPSSKPMA